MDEPASALDPIRDPALRGAVLPAEEGPTRLVIVTTTMQQAARVSDTRRFFWLGRLVRVGDR
jgi:phosphate transport system ATP-binding protein